MKFRNGFVSNSSSSSFIIAFSEMPTLSLGGSKSIPLTDLIPTREFWKDKETFIEDTWSNYCCYLEEGQTKEDACREELGWFDDALAALDAGKVLYNFDVDYNDETAERIMRMVPNDNIIMDNY